MINKFSPEVISKLKHYVYRLVDPRNGQTFYVGEGCGNRVFAHANAVDMSFYQNSEYLKEEDKPTEEDDDPAKIRRIALIKSKGLNVIHIIQRWGMDAKTAFEVESAFIDYLGLENLTNKIKGHEDERGMRWADDLELEFTAKTFDDYPNCPKFILIKIKDYSINKNGGIENNGIYKAVRGYWRINPSTANKYPYVLAVRYGIVVGVYQIEENGWKKLEDSERAYFDGTEAPDETKKIFLNKRIPERFRKKGSANPTIYCDRAS
jgi:hypothetical protein